MLGLNEVSLVDKSAISLKHEAFMDPNIGLFCLTLATKSRMKNAVGEQNAAVLHSWATYMTATSLMRCGLPVSTFILVNIAGYVFLLSSAWIFQSFENCTVAQSYFCFYGPFTDKFSYTLEV